MKEKKKKGGESRNWSGGGRSRPEVSGTGYNRDPHLMMHPMMYVL